MDLKGLKDQLTDQLKELGSKVQESSIYIELKEKFDTLPAQIQKLIVVGAVALFGLFLLSFPLGYLSDSQMLEEEFVENRELIRDLLRASSTLKERSPLPNSSSVAQIESKIQQVLEEMRLTPEQRGNIQQIPNARSRLASPAVNQEAVSMQVKTLNLRQLTELMHKLQTIGSGLQPISLRVQRSAGQTHYYDLIIKVFQFSLNIDEPEDTPAKPTRRPRGGR